MRTNIRLFGALILLSVCAMAFAPRTALAQAACYAAWNSSTAYTAGAEVSYNSVNYIANFWSQNSNPSTNNGGAGSGEPWTSQGACGGSSCAASPSAPTGLAASSTTSSSTNLSWSAVTPPTNCSISSYTVYKSGTSVGTSSSTSFSVTGLAASTTYTFTVAASDSFGTSGQSSSITVTTSAAASCSASPSAPTGLAASGTTSTGTSLSWSAVTPPANCSISSYTVYKSGTSIGTTSSTSFAVTGLSASTTYTFTVAATDSHGTSSQSSSITVTTPSASCSASPSAPSGLAASGTTSSSTTLSWTAVSPPANCSISSYTVYQNGTALSATGSTSYSVTGLAASTTYTFTVAASDSFGTGSKSSSITVTTSSSGGGGSGCPGVSAWNSTSVYTAGMQATYGGYLWTAAYWTQNNVPTAGGGGPWNIAGYCGSTPGTYSGAKSLPYVDVTLTAPYNAMSYSTSHYFTMAFVTDGGGCVPAWNGKAVSSNPDGLSALQTLRSSGGDAALSFGGANNSELATTCPSESALQAAYQAVITQYSLKRIDFDIEGGAPGNTSANDMRAKALVALQAANPGLQVTFTLPVETYGLDSACIALLQDAISDGVNITAINGMAMDFGGSYDNGGQMYLDMQLTAWSMMDQIQALYPSYSHTQVANLVGITPMIGENDLSTEVFTLANASSTVTFAQQQGIGMLAFWSESRDASCTSGESNYLCSNITQTPGEFASIFDGF